MKSAWALPMLAVALTAAPAWAAGLDLGAPRDTVAAPGVADSTASAPAVGADSVARATRPLLQVLLENGRSLPAERIQVLPHGALQLSGEGVPSRFIWSHEVREVRDERGRDRTREVLVEGSDLQVGGPEPKTAAKLAPRVRQAFLGAAAGPVLPVGDFHDVARTGVGLTAAFDLRVDRRKSFGIAVDFREFGASRDLERALAEDSGGVVDHIEFSCVGLGLTYRVGLLPDRRLDPFVRIGLEVQSFRTVLSGPRARSSDTATKFGLDWGPGLRVDLGGRTAAEILASYELVQVGSTGDRRYIQVRAGLSYRLGGRQARES